MANPRKLDPGLNSALRKVTDPNSRFEVVVRALRALAPDEAVYLSGLGVRGADRPGRQTFTGSVSKRAVEDLSDKPWIQSVSLSRPFKLAAEA